MKNRIEEEDDDPSEEELEMRRQEENEEEVKPQSKKPVPNITPKKTISNVEKYSMVEVPTQTQVMIRDSSDDKIYDLNAIICKIANDIELIKKNLV